VTLKTFVRIGVVSCVAATCVVAAGKLDDTVAVFDYQADLNAAASFNERTYPEIEFLADGARVLEDARLWMPADSRYALVEGPDAAAVSATSLRTFLHVLLMPRTLADERDRTAPWVLCYGCSPGMLGPEYTVLSDSKDGFLFARRQS
jgi:hypothetical protein